ncbi:hypothetical protein AVEN_13184-1, partial [Araneus ventricosus]
TTTRTPIHSQLDSATPDWPAEEGTTSFLYWTRPSPTRPAPESSEERSRRSALQSKMNSENLRTSAILSVPCIQFFADWRYVALRATTYSTPHRLVSTGRTAGGRIPTQDAYAITTARRNCTEFSVYFL